MHEPAEKLFFFSFRKIDSTMLQRCFKDCTLRSAAECNGGGSIQAASLFFFLVRLVCTDRFSIAILLGQSQ